MNPAIDNGFNSQNNAPNSIGNLVNNFNIFKQSLTGDPEQIVKGLISSGRMSKAQFEQYSQMANGLRNVLH